MAGYDINLSSSIASSWESAAAHLLQSLCGRGEASEEEIASAAETLKGQNVSHLEEEGAYGTIDLETPAEADHRAFSYLQLGIEISVVPEDFCPAPEPVVVEKVVEKEVIREVPVIKEVPVEKECPPKEECIPCGEWLVPEIIEYQPECPPQEECPPVQECKPEIIVKTKECPPQKECPKCPEGFVEP